MVGDDRLPQFLQGSQIYGPPPGAAGAESTKPGDDSWASSNVWICCDKCNRWRRVPKGVPTPSEDEPWDCSMNTWDYRYASCAVEEEPEAHDPEMPPSGPSAEQQNAVGGFGTMASAMPLPAATNTDGAAAKAADLARTGAESPSYYTTKQGRAGAGHLLIDFRLHGKHWVLGSVHGDSKAARLRSLRLYCSTGSGVAFPPKKQGGTSGLDDCFDGFGDATSGRDEYRWGGGQSS